MALKKTLGVILYMGNCPTCSHTIMSDPMTKEYLASCFWIPFNACTYCGLEVRMVKEVYQQTGWRHPKVSKLFIFDEDRNENVRML